VVPLEKQPAIEDFSAMRLFVALDIPDEARQALATLIARLKPKCPSARWVRPEAMHITLKFIGHTGTGNLQPIRDALAKIHAAAPIEVHFRGVGFFPNEKRPRVFWCGAEASPNAVPLAAEIDRALSPLGIEPETRPFTPHLTLARFKEDGARHRGKPSAGVYEIAEIVNAARELAGADFGALRTSEFHLFESKLSRSGAEYTRLETFHFAKAAD
jgi:RNA 2',3'-cyclic 3'-phosphodiesterase